MIVKFIKDTPSRNKKMTHKVGDEEPITDYKYGNMLIEKEIAIRIDNIPNTIEKILKEERKNKLKK